MNSTKYYTNSLGQTIANFDQRKDSKWQKRYVNSIDKIENVIKTISSVKTAPNEVNKDSKIDVEDVELNVVYLDGTTDVVNPDRIVCDTSKTGTATATAYCESAFRQFEDKNIEFTVTVV